MSVDILAALRDQAKRAREVAERVNVPDDRALLQQLAEQLSQIADRLERDARD